MQNDQMGFDFPTPPPVNATPPAPQRRGRKRAAVTGVAPQLQMATLDLETMAQQLQAHADYRVLRRLQPTMDWTMPPGGASEVVNVLVLDTETTGLDASKEVIIELALLRVQVDRTTGKPVGPVQVYDGLEDPGRAIPKEVVALTGITDEQVKGQRLDEQRIREMAEGVDLVIAHNAGFDRPFVERRLPAFAHLAWACSFADIGWKALGVGSAKLENLAQAQGWFYDAHRAEMDCHALLAVLAAPWPGIDATLLATLVAASERPAFKLSATQAPFDAKDALKARGYRWNGEQRVWQCRLPDEQALESECQWLRQHVYHQRHATVQVEVTDALARYSSRAGQLMQKTLP